MQNENYKKKGEEKESAPWFDGKCTNKKNLIRNLGK